MGKSGWPISRWTIRRPSASSFFAFARTSNAVSVPRRPIRSAYFIASAPRVGRIHPERRGGSRGRGRPSPAPRPTRRPLRRTWSGGAEGDRTPDLVNAIHALCQLSYSPGRHDGRDCAVDSAKVNLPRRRVARPARFARAAPRGALRSDRSFPFRARGSCALPVSACDRRRRGAEAGAIPARTRRCNRGRPSHDATARSGGGKARGKDDPGARRPIRGRVHSGAEWRGSWSPVRRSPRPEGPARPGDRGPVARSRRGGPLGRRRSGPERGGPRDALPLPSRPFRRRAAPVDARSPPRSPSARSPRCGGGSPAPSAGGFVAHFPDEGPGGGSVPPPVVPPPSFPAHARLGRLRRLARAHGVLRLVLERPRRLGEDALRHRRRRRRGRRREAARLRQRRPRAGPLDDVRDDEDRGPRPRGQPRPPGRRVEPDRLRLLPERRRDRGRAARLRARERGRQRLVPHVLERRRRRPDGGIGPADGRPREPDRPGRAAPRLVGRRDPARRPSSSRGPRASRSCAPLRRRGLLFVAMSNFIVRRALLRRGEVPRHGPGLRRRRDRVRAGRRARTPRGRDRDDRHGGLQRGRGHAARHARGPGPPPRDARRARRPTTPRARSCP